MIEWFYGKGGQQFGPIDEVTLSARIATGEIGPQDLVWNEGMDSWKPLQEIRHLAPSGNDSQSQDSEGLTPELSQSSYAPPAAIKAPALDDSFVDEVPQSSYAPPAEIKAPALDDSFVDEVPQSSYAPPASIFQTLGLRTKKTAGPITLLSKAYAVVIYLGFISIPLAILLFGFGCEACT
ncbi:GYF domain-containing protein [Akkermansiaceae bacterium]|nr:GYF domain-containing protein [Akkermansiaceae bacterium]